MPELKGSKTEQNLWTAFAGESQARNKYDYFASKAKNFAEADRIRDELKAHGIEITDVPGGASWKRV